MRELYREPDFSTIGFHQSILEAEGIATHVRNRDLGTMTTEVPLPDMFPALCVMEDEDYERAMAILKETATPATPRLQEPMKPVFLIGVVLIFGTYGIGTTAILLNGGFDLDETGYALTALYSILTLGSLWIAVSTVLRFLRERRSGVDS